MSSTYLAFFATAERMDELKDVNWADHDEVQRFFSHIQDDQTNARTWGGSANGWVLSAVTDWISKKYGVSEFGSKLGVELLNDCEYVHWALTPADQAQVAETLKGADPRNDETFAPMISEYFEKLGSDYVEGYVEDDFDDYYQTFDDLRADLSERKEKNLVVLIPF